MKLQPFALALTVINLVLMIFLFARMLPAMAQQKDASVPQVIKAHSLEIVDSRGRTRASISVLPPVTVDGKLYPETALFRLITSQGKPIVKIGAAENGAG